MKILRNKRARRFVEEPHVLFWRQPRKEPGELKKLAREHVGTTLRVFVIGAVLAIAAELLLGHLLIDRSRWALVILPLVGPFILWNSIGSAWLKGRFGKRRVYILRDEVLEVWEPGGGRYSIKLNRVESMAVEHRQGHPTPFLLLAGRKLANGRHWLPLPASGRRRARVVSAFEEQFEAAAPGTAEAVEGYRKVAFLQERGVQIAVAVWVVITVPAALLIAHLGRLDQMMVAFILMLITWFVGPALWWAVLFHRDRLKKEPAFRGGVFLAGGVASVITVFATMIAAVVVGGAVVLRELEEAREFEAARGRVPPATRPSSAQ